MKLFKLFISIVFLVGFFSCKKDTIMTYNSENSIYFAPAVFNMPLSISPLVDTTAVSFAFSGGTAKDSVIQLFIVVTGPSATVDREYKLVFDKDSSTAIAGTHFIEPNATQYIKAGKVRDTVNLKLLRTPDMVNNNFKIVFRLIENDYFNTNMLYKIISSTRTLYYTRYTVNVNDILATPKRWLDAYLGTFTRKKLFMICDMLNTTPAYIDTQASVGDILFYGQYMQRYLNQMDKDGKTIYEEDGITPMKMGSLVQ